MNRIQLLAATLLAAFFCSGCGNSSNPKDAPQMIYGASFKPGTGLELPEETQKALHLKFVEVSSRSLRSASQFRVQIYFESGDTSPSSIPVKPKHAYGTGILPLEKLRAIKTGATVFLKSPSASAHRIEAKLIRINKLAQSALGGVELILEIPDPDHAFVVGTDLEAFIDGEEGLSASVIPLTALLKTFHGTFVYVVNGDAYLRTEVKTGSQNSEFIEIVDGLYEGDEIVKEPVMALWLSELQATNAGQSCCVIGH